MAVEDNLEKWESVRNPVGEYFCASGYMWIVNWDHESGCCLMGPEENLDWQCEVAPRLGWRTGWWRRLETALEQTIEVQFSLESRWRRIACIGGLLLNMEGWGVEKGLPISLCGRQICSGSCSVCLWLINVFIQPSLFCISWLNLLSYHLLKETNLY